MVTSLAGVEGRTSVQVGACDRESVAIGVLLLLVEAVSRAVLTSLSVLVGRRFQQGPEQVQELAITLAKQSFKRVV